MSHEAGKRGMADYLERLRVLMELEKFRDVAERFETPEDWLEAVMSELGGHLRRKAVREKLQAFSTVEDMVQEWIERLPRWLETWPGVGSYLAYALRSGHNHMVDRYNKIAREREVLQRASAFGRSDGTVPGMGAAPPVPGEDGGSCPAAGTRRDGPSLEDVRACMARLSDRDRKLLNLRVVEGLSHREIADRIGSTPRAVCVACGRARVLGTTCPCREPRPSAHPLRAEHGQRGAGPVPPGRAGSPALRPSAPRLCCRGHPRPGTLPPSATDLSEAL